MYILGVYDVGHMYVLFLNYYLWLFLLVHPTFLCYERGFHM